MSFICRQKSESRTVLPLVLNAICVVFHPIFFRIFPNIFRHTHIRTFLFKSDALNTITKVCQTFCVTFMRCFCDNMRLSYWFIHTPIKKSCFWKITSFVLRTYLFFKSCLLFYFMCSALSLHVSNMWRFALFSVFVFFSGFSSHPKFVLWYGLSLQRSKEARIFFTHEQRLHGKCLGVYLLKWE